MSKIWLLQNLTKKKFLPKRTINWVGNKDSQTINATPIDDAVYIQSELCMHIVTSYTYQIKSSMSNSNSDSNKNFQEK